MTPLSDKNRDIPQLPEKNNQNFLPKAAGKAIHNIFL